MIKIEVTLKSPGDITQLPDSQKIFGGLMSMYSKEYGSHMATEFVKEIYNGKAKLMISSLFPKGYLPFPREYILNLLSKNNVSHEDPKKLYKELKELHYVREKGLLNFLSKALKENNDSLSNDFKIFLNAVKHDYIKVKYYPQQRVGISNEIAGIPSVENNLYSTPKVHVFNKDKGYIKNEVKDYMFWIIADNDKMTERMKDFLSIIEKSCSNRELIILGRRATQGSNIYSFNECKGVEREYEESEYFINLGKLIPDNMDYKRSYLDLFTSERRPYNNNLILDKKWHDKCFISFIKEGSIIYKPKDLSIFGVSKSIKNPFNDDTIIFGNSLLYKL